MFLPEVMPVIITLAVPKSKGWQDRPMPESSGHADYRNERDSGKGIGMSKVEFNIEMEYKVVKVPMKGIFSKDVSPELENILNKEGKDGWRLADTVIPTSTGDSIRLVLILCRPA